MRTLSLLLLCFLLTLSTDISAQKNKKEEKDESKFTSQAFSGLKMRSIGPAFASGRIADIAVHPNDVNVWYVAVGSGGVWKTNNAGTTWKPIFDNETSYSIGCITIDPSNPNTIWVGTGENVGGRHVGYGDGIYKSEDNGSTWKNMGLQGTEHISRIIVHPENSDILWVAAQGPLWNKGGERGLYKTTDGGKNWKRVLGDDEWVGVTEIVVDPRDPKWMYAATWQRHRTVAAYMGGGPGTGIHRSTDGGETWTEMKKGLPGSNMGKIGLAISPQNPDNVYAAIELDRRSGGVYMSSNRGVSWTKQSNTVSGATGPHYYQELYACPHAEGRLYLMDVRIQVSDDHGKNFRRLTERNKHSDNHSINFRMDDPDYLLVGTDAGIYESFDLAQTWRFIANLPLTQYYKVAVDDAEPFYNVYGGTQDNGSHGGPSQTDDVVGIRNADWWKTLGADGHQSATEPGNPNITYAETQRGGLHRIDQITGEQVFIQPQAGEGEPYERFNWDAPILVSPFSPTRLYFASYRVWRSDNRGDSWTAISGDLTRGDKRIELPIMGRKQSWDNAWDISAMSDYSTITSLAESPLMEGLIYVGTDDGLIQVTENGGGAWSKVEVSSLPGVPKRAFVNDIRADLFDANTVYVALDNHKEGDFKPYLYKSTDRGKTWKSIAGNIPDRTLVWRLVQDHVKKDLLFAATEFGVYFTIDGGMKWAMLKGGVPTISFRDIVIQRRENDLVGATFGRGFYILDDYSPLRMVNEEMLASGATLFPIKDALWYRQRNSAAVGGASRYAAENPDFGATFTYYLAESTPTLKSERKKKEKELAKAKADIQFPGWDAIEAENNQDKPKIVFMVHDANGKYVNSVHGKASKGFHRVSWNLRKASKDGIELDDRDQGPSSGFLVTPGTYNVTMWKVVDGVMEKLTEPMEFNVVPLRDGALERIPEAEVIAFQQEMEAFQQELTAANVEFEKCEGKLNAMKIAFDRCENPNPALYKKIHDTQKMLTQLNIDVNGHEAKGEVGARNRPSPRSRMFVGWRGLNTTYGPTKLHRETVAIGKKELAAAKTRLTEISSKILPELEKELEAAGAPWIEGQGLIGN